MMLHAAGNDARRDAHASEAQRFAFFALRAVR
jgi:hypothetical protein